MRLSFFLPIAAILLLAACSGGPSYHGREASTEGMPGVINGKKVHPTVKLGKPYSVSGTDYVPRYQPDYVEEGMASWYGPGFHGGRTANGETFSTDDYTAAHTTLPMPSIVKVTHLGNGQSVYVRINDRGPFAHGRIIDLSKAAAQKIGLIRDGVAKVRVEYMPNESQRFADLLATGRDPHSIDLEREVIGQGATQYAGVTPPDTSVAVVDTMPVSSAPLAPPAQPSDWWQRVNPIATAHAEEPVAPAPASPFPAAIEAQGMTAGQPSISATSTIAHPVQTGHLPPQLPPAGEAGASSVTISAIEPAKPAMLTDPAQAPPAPDRQPAPAGHSYYVQLGAFANQQNAQRLQERVADMATTSITAGNVGGIALYRVRMGPFLSEDAAQEVLARTRTLGMPDAKLVTEYN